VPSPHRRGRKVASCVAVLGTVTALTLTGVPRSVAQPLPAFSPGGEDTAASQRDRKGNYDARSSSVKEKLDAARKAAAKGGTARSELTEELGTQGVQQIDPATGTPVMVGRLDGFLTKRSKSSATTVVLRYLRAHLSALGLTEKDLGTLVLTRRYVDVAGIEHLSWVQTLDGIQVFGNGLKANVTKNGELISLQGSPISGLSDLAAQSQRRQALTAPQARAQAASDVGGKASTDVRSTSTKAGRLVTWSNDDQAQLVWFVADGKARLGWSTYVQAGGDLNYTHVIDAQTGTVLYRHDTTNNDRPAAPATGSSDAAATSPVTPRKGRALVFNNYPGAPEGGKQEVYDLVKNGLISANSSVLSGNYVNAFADVNDNNVADSNETVPVPGSTTSKAQYPLVSFNSANSLCSSSFVCTWDPEKAGSWATNAAADVTQGFYFNSVYHNYLKAVPFGFSRAAGNFESRDGDAVQLNALDGANTDEGLPDRAHVNNANMSTPPDGIAPTMQMYLFHRPGRTNAQDPFVPTSSTFAGDVILHEYTHGLSNRLVVDATGNSTLNSIQGGSMGEAWSDYYALDYLVNKGYEKDTTTSGQVREGKYVLAGDSIRTMGIDCPVSTKAASCQQRSGAVGGYTYGDFSDVAGFPEVHASGEIWAQALWDLRGSLGHTVTGMLVTRAMELSPSDPSFLDMRNAILQADLAVYGGKHTSKIWSVFAKRGMGFFAAATDGGDTQPVEDFSKPPAKGAATASVVGHVRDGLTGAPVVRALVSIAGHNSGYSGDFTDLTGPTGRFEIKNVPVGTYPIVQTYGPGYEVLRQRLTVTKGKTRVNYKPRRDWAASSGGGEIASFTGPDYTPACGPGYAIDLSQGRGWGSTTGDDDGTPTNVMIPKSIVVQLPAAITLSSFAVDPSNTCGDDETAATGRYRIETSPNGTTWTQAAAGTFTPDDLGQLNEVPVAAPVTNVSYVRFTMLSNQTPNFATACPTSGDSGCSYTDMSELEVFGIS